MAEPQLATTQDLPSVVSTFLTCFDNDYFRVLFPPNDAGKRYLETAFASFISDDEPGKLYVIRDGEGAVKALTLYFEGRIDHRTRWPAFGEGLDHEKLKEFFEGMDEQHLVAMGSTKHVCMCPSLPFLYAYTPYILTDGPQDLELIMTRPEHQKQGLASKLIQLVIDAADDRPIYLDASSDAVGLYERLGFEKMADSIRTSEMMRPMVRPGGPN